MRRLVLPAAFLLVLSACVTKTQSEFEGSGVIRGTFRMDDSVLHDGDCRSDGRPSLGGIIRSTARADVDQMWTERGSGADSAVRENLG